MKPSNPNPPAFEGTPGFSRALKPAADASVGSFPRTSVRVRATNPNHHLWNNNGTWYLHYTLHPTSLTKSRVRMSLETKDVEVARHKRDEILARATGV
jgi:hypothetical protein